MERKDAYMETRFDSIQVGDVVYEGQIRGSCDIDYHPAIVLGVCADKRSLRVLDVSREGNPERLFSDFVTAEEAGINPTKDREIYASVIESVLSGKITVSKE